MNNENDNFSAVFETEKFPAANELIGITLCDRWEIKKLLHDGPQESGGNFGVGYIVYDLQEKQERFLKVVDYQRRMRDIAQLTRLLTEAQFEVAIQKYCTEKRMSKVVRMIANGQLIFKKTASDDEYTFLAIVMERGEGDIKNHVHYAPNQSPSWKLAVLRDVALAVLQIERANLAHNDVKPSNIIRFKSNGDNHSVKLGDIGRVVRKDGQGPFDGMDWAGDPRHKPIETLYGWKEPDWQNRRTAADAYMLGNLMAYLFAGASVTERVINSLPPEYQPANYAGSYRQILDVVRHTWISVVESQIGPAFPEDLRDKLKVIFCSLTEPDPKERGDKSARRRGLVGIDRIQSKLVQLCHRAQIHERTGAPK
jgi:serine/threonine protein kinase